MELLALSVVMVDLNLRRCLRERNTIDARVQVCFATLTLYARQTLHGASFTSLKRRAVHMPNPEPFPFALSGGGTASSLPCFRPLFV